VDNIQKGDIVFRENNRIVKQLEINSIEISEGEFIVYTINTEKPNNNYWVNNYLFDPPASGVGIDLLQARVYYHLGNIISWAPGKFGSAVNFNSVDSVISTPESTTTDLGATTDSYTVSAWMKTNYNNSGSAIIVDKYHGSAKSAFQLGLDSTEHAFFQISDGTNWPAAYGSMAMNDGNWHYYTGIRDVATDKVYMYIDGVLIDSNTDTTTETVANNADIAIGNGDSLYDQGLFGSVDEVKIYNYARTSSQIIEDMNAGHPAPGSPVGSAIGHWEFEEGYGDTTHDSGTGGNNGDLASSGTTCPQTGDSACPTWTNEGKFGKALDFEVDGTTDDYVDIGNPSNLRITGAITLSAWVNNESLVQNTRYITKSDGAGFRGWELYFSGDTTDLAGFQISSDGTLQSTVETTFPLSASTWYHLVGVYEPGTAVKIYVNGVLNNQNTSSIPASQKDNSLNVFIGNRTACSNCYMDGKIDDVRVYNSALTADEVKLLYNQGFAASMGVLSTASSSATITSSARSYCPPGDTGTCNPPLGEWKFDENTGTTAYDTSGNGNTGTFTNGPTWSTGKTGGAGKFDGSDDFVEIGSSSKIDNSQTGTITAWVNTNTITADGSIFNYGGASIANAGVFEFKLSNISGSNTYLGIKQRSNGVATINAFRGSTLLSTNTWYYVTLVSNGSTWKMYLNGIEQTLTSISGTNNGNWLGDTTVTETDRTTIGRNYSNGAYSGPFNGLIDDVKIYNYVRTPAQIAWDYNQGAPAAQYDFDECSGSVLHDTAPKSDVSTSGLNGTIVPGSAPNSSVGTCTTVDTATMWYNGASGKYSGSLDFDGTNDYVSLGNQVFGNMSSSQYTISAWVKTSSTALVKEIFSQYSSGVCGGIDFRIYNDSPNVVSLYDGLSVSVKGRTPIYTGNWYHVLASVDGTKTQIYVNGKLDSQGVPLTWSSCPTVDVRIGSRIASGNPDLPFDGQIDEVKIWRYALTSEQVKSVYNQGSAVRF
jgi:hypothetical protein